MIALVPELYGLHSLSQQITIVLVPERQRIIAYAIQVDNVLLNNGLERIMSQQTRIVLVFELQSIMAYAIRVYKQGLHWFFNTAKINLTRTGLSRGACMIRKLQIADLHGDWMTCASGLDCDHDKENHLKFYFNAHYQLLIQFLNIKLFSK